MGNHAPRIPLSGRGILSPDLGKTLGSCFPKSTEHEDVDPEFSPWKHGLVGAGTDWEEASAAARLWRARAQESSLNEGQEPGQDGAMS